MESLVCEDDDNLEQKSQSIKIPEDQQKELDKKIDDFAQNLIDNKALSSITNVEDNTKEAISLSIAKDNKFSIGEDTLKKFKLENFMIENILWLGHKYSKSYKNLINYLDKRDEDNFKDSIKIGDFQNTTNLIKMISQKLGISVDFCNEIAQIQGKKHGTVVGPGEVLLALILKGGSLANKGDVSVNDVTYEVKTPDGHISEGKKPSDCRQEINNFIKQYSDSGETVPEFKSFAALESFNFFNTQNKFIQRSEEEKKQIIYDFFKTVCQVSFPLTDSEINSILDGITFNIENINATFKENIDFIFDSFFDKFPIEDTITLKRSNFNITSTTNKDQFKQMKKALNSQLKACERKAQEIIDLSKTTDKDRDKFKSIKDEIPKLNSLLDSLLKSASNDNNVGKNSFISKNNFAILRKKLICACFDKYKGEIDFAELIFYDYKNDLIKFVADAQDFFNSFNFNMPSFGGKDEGPSHVAIVIKSLKK